MAVMIQEQIISYFRTQIEELSSHLHVAGLPVSTDEVHDTRVCIKKIRAFLRVFKMKSKNKKIRKLHKKGLSIIFKTAGKLRDLEIQKYLLKDYENLLNQNFSGLEKKVNEKIGQEQKNLREILSASQKDFLPIFQQEVSNEIESLKDEIIIESINNYLVKAIRKSGENRHRIIPKILHKQRIILKEIRYCLEMSGEMISDMHAEDQVSRIKEMEDILGSWHDYNILNRTVEKYMQKLKKAEADDVNKMNS